MNKVVMRWPATSDDLDYVTRISVTVRQPCHSSILLADYNNSQTDTSMQSTTSRKDDAEQRPKTSLVYVNPRQFS